MHLNWLLAFSTFSPLDELSRDESREEVPLIPIAQKRKESSGKEKWVVVETKKESVNSTSDER
jgi:hypothetical protein